MNMLKVNKVLKVKTLLLIIIAVLLLSTIIVLPVANAQDFDMQYIGYHNAPNGDEEFLFKMSGYNPRSRTIVADIFLRFDGNDEWISINPSIISNFSDYDPVNHVLQITICRYDLTFYKGMYIKYTTTGQHYKTVVKHFKFADLINKGKYLSQKDVKFLMYNSTASRVDRIMVGILLIALVVSAIILAVIYIIPLFSNTHKEYEHGGEQK
jgi:hypothetical protein